MGVEDGALGRALEASPEYRRPFTKWVGKKNTTTSLVEDSISTATQY